MKTYIFFASSDVRWYMRFLDPKHQHCWMAKVVHTNNDRTERLITFENLYNYISIDTIITRPEHIFGHLPRVKSVVEYHTVVDPYKSSLPELITCVTTLKKILGIHKLSIQTPLQLKQYLLQHGGNVIWEHYSEHRNQTHQLLKREKKQPEKKS